MSFGGVAGLEIGPLRLTDPPNHFIECSDCSQVRVHDLQATAPNNSPNTVYPRTARVRSWWPGPELACCPDQPCSGTSCCTLAFL